MIPALPMSRVLVLGLLAAGCVSSSWEGLQSEVEKQEDDLRIASLAKATMEFDKVVFRSSDGLATPSRCSGPATAGTTR